MQTSLFSRVFSTFVSFVPAGSGPVASITANSRAGNFLAARSLSDLSRVNDLSPAELSTLLASLAVRRPGDEYGTDDSGLTALNLLSGNVGEATAQAQAERWALAWLDRDMSGVMRDVRAELSSNDGDGQGRFFAGCVSDLLLLRGTVNRQAFVATVLTMFNAGRTVH